MTYLSSASSVCSVLDFSMNLNSGVVFTPAHKHSHLAEQVWARVDNTVVSGHPELAEAPAALTFCSFLSWGQMCTADCLRLPVQGLVHT